MIESASNALPTKIAATISASTARDPSSFRSGECSIMTVARYATGLEEACRNKAFVALTIARRVARGDGKRAAAAALQVGE